MYDARTTNGVHSERSGSRKDHALIEELDLQLTARESMKSLIACVLILFGVLLASLPACAREPATAPVEFTNRLIGEKSPYLLQHAHNPVDWYPWGEEAFAKSRKENKPIFLSVGYSTCHWCHVMAHESFENG